MKLFNKGHAGLTMKSQWGEVAVDKEGYANVANKDMQKILLDSGWEDAKKMEAALAEEEKKSKEELKTAQAEHDENKAQVKAGHERAKQALRDNGKEVVDAIERERDMISGDKKAISAADDRDTEREFVRQEVRKTGWKRSTES